MNYIKDVQLKQNNGYNAIIEIPKGVKDKYELVDGSFDHLIVVRKMSHKYPYYYGCFTQTHADDNDPLDFILLTKIKFKSLDIVNVQPIAVVKTVDHNEVDDKVICVLKDENIKTDKLLKHTMKFLQSFKGKNSRTIVDPNIYGMDEAIKTLDRNHETYMNDLQAKTIKIF